MAEETRIIYHLEDQDTPYLIRINVPAQRVTLADFKHALNKPSGKFFFKSEDEDFGVVKEEISDDESRLPLINGRVVCWVVSSDTCPSDFGGCDSQSVATPTCQAPPPPERTGVIGQSRPPSFQGSETWDGPGGQKGAGPTAEGDDSSTQQQHNSDTETETSSLSSEEDARRCSQSTEQSSSSPRQRHLKMEKSLSSSSLTDSSVSLNVFTVSLNLDRTSFLGLSIVGQSSDRGDGGIYVGSVMKGGAVAEDGRIQPGDMLLQVNDVQFDNMNNDDAVRVLRDIVHQPGPVTLTVAKCWDPNPPGFSLPMGEPVRPIDPAAWVSHTAAMTGRLLPHYGVPEDPPQLSVHSDMETVVTAMASPEAGLEVRDRMWLKISIPNAFLGSDMVDWLQKNVEGFVDRREVRRYAGTLLKAGLILHTVNKVSFSEQRYYVFRDPGPDLLHLPGTSGTEPLAPPAGPQGPPESPYQDHTPHQEEAGGGAGGGGEGED